jgi:hypothetical protein
LWPQALQGLRTEAADLAKLLDAAEPAFAFTVLKDGARLARTYPADGLQRRRVSGVEVDRRAGCRRDEQEYGRQQANGDDSAQAGHGWLQRDSSKPGSPALRVCPGQTHGASVI